MTNDETVYPSHEPSALDEHELEGPVRIEDVLAGDDAALKYVHAVEDEIGLKRGFLNDLLNEDDWSFVIKLHALLEAAVTHLLTEVIGDERLKPIFARMEMSNPTLSKVVVAERLELIDRDSRRFLQKLSEIRNAFVHSVGFVGARLDAYVDTLPTGDQKGLSKACCWGYKTADEIVFKVGEDQYDVTLLLKKMAFIAWDASPKISIWVSTQVILWNLARHIALTRLDREAMGLRLELFKMLKKITLD